MSSINFKTKEINDEKIFGSKASILIGRNKGCYVANTLINSINSPLIYCFKQSGLLMKFINVLATSQPLLGPVRTEALGPKPFSSKIA